MEIIPLPLVVLASVCMILITIYIRHKNMKVCTSAESGNIEVSKPCKNHDNCETSGFVPFTGIPTTNGGHTTVIICRCAKCDEAIPFENLDLATPEAVQEIKAMLQKAGWKTGLI